MRFAILCSAIILTSIAAGCGFTPDIIVVLPDSPLLIAEVKGRYMRTFAYQKSSNAMKEVGWSSAHNFVGRTMVSFDWDVEIAKGRSNAGSDRGSNP